MLLLLVRYEVTDGTWVILSIIVFPVLQLTEKGIGDRSRLDLWVHSVRFDRQVPVPSG